MIVLEIPVLECHRCDKPFTPQIDATHHTIKIPNRCPNRECRSQTWNVPDDELSIIKEKQLKNLSLGGYRGSIHIRKVPVLNKYKPKKKQIENVLVCLLCELFFADEPSLKRHHQRRHNGLCHTCNSSNQIFRLHNGKPICQKCFEVKK